MQQAPVAERILEAVISLIATRGTEGVTVRNAAAAAGVSPGAVQHHYPAKDDLLVAALAHIAGQFRELAYERAQRAKDPRAQLRIVLELLACTDERDLVGGIVWTAFAARATVTPRLRTVQAEMWQHMEQRIGELLRHAYPQARHDENAAALLLAITDGIAVARVAEGTERMSETRARELLELALRPYE